MQMEPLPASRPLDGAESPNALVAGQILHVTEETGRGSRIGQDKLLGASAVETNGADPTRSTVRES